MRRLRRARPGGSARVPRAWRSVTTWSARLWEYKMRGALVAGVMAGCIALAVSLHSFIFASEHFLVRDIEVIDKNPQAIDYSLARLRQPANIFLLDLAAIQQRLEQVYPEIQMVRVSRVLPNKLVLEIIHRRPVAQFEVISRSDGARVYYTVNEDGYVLATSGAVPRRNLPVITGVGLRPQEVEIGRSYERSAITTALALRRQLMARDIWQHYPISRIDVTHPRSIVFHIEDRIEVRLGTAEAEARLDHLAGILQSERVDQTRGTYIDLRFNEVVIGSR